MKASSRLKLIVATASAVRTSTRPGGPTVGHRLQAVPRLVRATLSGGYAGTTTARLGLLAAAVAYVASPIDLIPEALLPVLGAVDDAVVISWAVRTLVDETDRFLAWELGQGVRRDDHRVVSDLAPQRAEQGASGAGPRSAGPVREAATNYVLESVRRRLER